MLEVDRLDFDEGEVALPFLRRTHLAGDGVAGVQVEAADLRGRDVDVVRAGQVVVLGRAQEAEAVGQAFQHAFGEDQARLLGLRLEDREDQVLLAHAGGVLDAVLLGELGEIGELHLLEHADVERLGGLGLIARGSAAARRRSDSSGTSLATSTIGSAGFSGAGFSGSGSAIDDCSRRLFFDARQLFRLSVCAWSCAPASRLSAFSTGAARLRRRSIRFRILFRTLVQTSLIE